MKSSDGFCYVTMISRYERANLLQNVVPGDTKEITALEIRLKSQDPCVKSVPLHELTS